MHRWFGTLVAALLMTASLAAGASEIVKYDEARFAALREAGTPVVVLVHAPWCPTCKRQHEVLAQLLGQDRYKAYTLVEVDFDTQRDAMKSLRAPQRSTVIVLRGKDEWGRSTAITAESSLAMLLDQGLQ